MITPFADDGTIDFGLVDKLTDWYLLSGCAGIFTPCLSSEMFQLSPAERISLAKHVKERVVAAEHPAVVFGTGTFGGPISEQAAFVNEMGAVCDGVVVNTALLAMPADPESVWQANAQALLDATGTVRLGLYECPVPYKRLLSAELLGWCAATRRFTFHKDTCCRTDEMRAKLARVAEAAGTAEGDSPFRFYNANVETLLASIRMGGHGFSGISANFYPHLHAYLCATASLPSPTPEEEQGIVRVQV